MGKALIILVVGLSVIVGIVSVSIFGRSSNASKAAATSYKRTNAKNISSSTAEYYFRQLKTTPTLRGTFSISPILDGTASVSIADWTFGISDSVRLVSVGVYGGVVETTIVKIKAGTSNFPEPNAALDINVPEDLSFSYGGTLAIDGRDHDMSGVLLAPSANDRPGVGLSNAGEVSEILPAYAGNMFGTTDVLAPVTIINPSTYVADLISRADYVFTGDVTTAQTWGSAVSPKIVYCAPGFAKFTNTCSGWGVLIIDATTFESTGSFTFRGLVIAYSTLSDDFDWKSSNQMRIYGGVVTYAEEDLVFQPAGLCNIYRSTAALNLARTLFSGGSGGMMIAGWYE